MNESSDTDLSSPTQPTASIGSTTSPESTGSSSSSHASSGDASPELPTVQEAVLMWQAALGQIDFARRYTLELLDATPESRWYEIPAGHVSHVAWQVGHLAVSQYGLLMFRIRGRRPEDLDLVPGRFRKTFGRGGKPPAEDPKHPTATQLRERLDQIHRQAMDELAQVEPAVLLEPVDMPYAVYPCKLGAILFCPMHESLHAGQIGALRRGLGLDSIR